MFNCIVVWRVIFVLWCGCFEGKVNIIIIILFLDLLDICIVGFVYLFIYYVVMVVCLV